MPVGMRVRVEIAQQKGRWTLSCTLLKVSKYLPIARRRVTPSHFRGGQRLRDPFSFNYPVRPEEIASIASLWPQQYTGPQDSFFYRYILKGVSD